MSNNCGKCKKPASSRDLLRCYGKCKIGFHPNCIDYKMDSWGKLFKECPYAKFICLDCQGDSDGFMSAELLCLKEEFCRLAEIVDALTAKIDYGMQKVVHDVSEKIDQINNRTSAAAMQSAHESGGLIHQDGVDVSPKPAIRRIYKPQSECIVGSCVDVDETIKAAQVKKHIYASKFSNSTVPAALCKFLSGKLAVSETDFDCHLLVSANKDVSQLNFVSFKIGVDPDLFDKLLQPDIWPSGVLVREFVTRSKNLKHATLF